MSSPHEDYRWIILAAGVLAQGSFAVVFLGLPALGPALRAEYGLSLGQVGVVFAASNLGTLLTVLAWGLLADRFGERLVVAGGLAAEGLALAGAAELRGFGALTALLFAAGALGACVQAASGRAVMGWFPARERGLALGIRQTATPVGGAAAALVLPRLADAGGVRAALLALAALALAVALSSALLLRERPAAIEEAGDARPFRDLRVWQLCGASALLYVPLAVLTGFLVLFLHDSRGLSATTAGAVLALGQLVGAVLRLGAGRLSDRLGDRVGLLRRLGLAMAATGALAAALVHAPNAALVPAFVVAAGLSLSWNGLSFTAAAELAGYARSGASLGLQQTALAASSVLTPVAFTGLVSASSWRIGFGLSAAAALAGSLALRGLDGRRESR